MSDSGTYGGRPRERDISVETSDMFDIYVSYSISPDFQGFI